MKKLLFAYLVLAISILFVTSLNASVINQDKKDATVKSLAHGISSENFGLKTSAALQLGRLIDINYLTQDDANKALIPLLNMLQNGNSEEEYEDAYWPTNNDWKWNWDLSIKRCSKI